MKRCLVCERAIVEEPTGMRGATIWRSHGNYGSAVYDPVDESVFLEAVLCDACLLAKQHVLKEVVVTQHSPIEERRQPDFGA